MKSILPAALLSLTVGIVVFILMWLTPGLRKLRWDLKNNYKAFREGYEDGFEAGKKSITLTNEKVKNKDE